MFHAPTCRLMPFLRVSSTEIILAVVINKANVLCAHVQVDTIFKSILHRDPQQRLSLTAFQRLLEDERVWATKSSCRRAGRNAFVARLSGRTRAFLRDLPERSKAKGTERSAWYNRIEKGDEWWKTVH